MRFVTFLKAAITNSFLEQLVSRSESPRQNGILAPLNNKSY